MFVIRKKLSATDLTPTTIRYNVDCDCIQTTFDDGTTWTDSPGSDPRSSPAFRAPVSTADDPQCVAATGMVAKLRELVDADLAADNAAALVVLWFGILIFAMPFFGWLADLLLLAADAIVTIGGAAISAAFTEDVYAAFVCAFYENIGSNGQMSDSQLANLYTRVASDFDLVVQAVFGLHSSTLGAVGWSNVGALATAAGSCDCAWCYQADLTTTDLAYTAFTNADWGNVAVWTSGVGWQGAINASRGGHGAETASFVGFWSATEPDIHYTKFQATVSFTYGAGSGLDVIPVYLGSELLFTLSGDYSGVLTWTGDYTTVMGDIIQFGSSTGSVIGYNASGAAGGSFVLTELRVEGTGTNPAPSFPCS